MTVIKDLAQTHGYVGTLFPEPGPRGHVNHTLASHQVDFYQEYGYLAGIKVLEPEQADQLLSELGEIQNPAHPSNKLFYEFNTNESADPAKVLFHALGAWRTSPGFHDILWNPAFTVPASQLLGGSVRFWHDQLFCKPAHHGGVVAWHQDYSYWTRTTPMNHLTCWIALEDSTRDNGCVHYVPGSHRWNLLPITGLAGDMNAIREVLTPAQWSDFNRHVPIELKKGYATFHHPLLVHGSFENKTARQRRATVINAILDGVMSDSDAPLLHGVPAIPKGHPLGGMFFPLLLDSRDMPS